jgi:alanyl-tRNA synthetase
MYLSFFESKNHTRMASASLVPQGDKSLLLINSGMAPLKKFFLGQAVPPNKRVTTCQKCIRTPDIERVGKTARHGTYFEMLGNFSFGDYFKTEAIEWAWEFFTKVVELPVDKLHVSVFEEDDEAYDIWTKHIGVAPDHMVHLGREDNFWEHGSGPCGPCSEIYFDRGPEKGCGKPDCHVGCECDRFVEVWNLVFSQYDSDGNGHYAEMEHKNIDTGMGLERLACVVQEVDNLFEVDTVQNIMKHISNIAGVKYKENDKTDVSLRVITDHIRSTTFMIGDGILPSNEGRGYVLRRLLRRAARHGRLLGITKPFLYEVCDTVINENKSAYPELAEKREYIRKVIEKEEEAFAKTIDKGMELLNEFIETAQKENKKVLSGDDCFKLSDTYGFPIDLTIEIAGEKGLTVDQTRFDELTAQQRETARADHLAKANSSWADNSIKIEAPKTNFVGYSENTADAKILAIYKDSTLVDEALGDDTAAIVLDTTPFYAESGGQIGDSGIISTDSAVFEVSSTIKTEDGHFLHLGTVTDGSLKTGDSVKAQIDTEKRLATMRNHTTAHILQAALREVLGDHVHQAGQLVNDKNVRFDFSHFSALTAEELSKVENIVNEKILSAIEVTTKEMPIEEARKLGAMALFGEKYGDVVRVVSIGDYSIEFCGGTHMDNTSKIGLFKIVSESSVASGVRRIEAVTGTNVINLLDSYIAITAKSASAFKLPDVLALPEKCASVMSELKSKDKEIQKLSAKLASGKLERIFDTAAEVNGVKVISTMINGAGSKELQDLGDQVKSRDGAIVALFAGTTGDKGTFYCVATKSAQDKGAHAGKIVQRIAAITGGKGGGRPDHAMAGIGKTYMVDEALMSLENVLKEFIG